MKGALTGAVAAWLGLIALSAVGSSGGSGRIASLLDAANTLVERALDPTVPAIPDRRTTTSAQTSAATSAATYVPATTTTTPRIPVPATISV